MPEPSAPSPDEIVQTVRAAFENNILPRPEGGPLVASVGPYVFEYERHDRGDRLRVHAVVGNDKIVVFRRDRWTQRSDEHLSRHDVQGWQADGPWVGQVGAVVARWRTEIDRREIELLRLHQERARLNAAAEADRLNMFRDALARVPALPA